MSLQKQHFLLRYVKSECWFGRSLRRLSAQQTQRSPDWANQAGVQKKAINIELVNPSSVRSRLRKSKNTSF